MINHSKWILTPDIQVGNILNMKQVKVFFLLLLFSAPVLSQDSICEKFINTPLLAPQPGSIEGAGSYIYKSIGGIDLRLHVFGSGSEKQPVLVFFFGGGWKWGRVTDFREQAGYFAARGMKSVLVEYRTDCRQKVSVVDEVEDAKSAIRWVRSHADELGIDSSRVAVSGASSGGHLALGAASFDRLDNPDEDPGISSRPDLLLLFYPCVDLTLEIEMEYSSEVIGNHGYEMSPLFHIPRDLPPVIIFQGTVDPLYASVRKFCEDAGNLGNQCKFVEYAGAQHGFLNQRSDEEVAWVIDTIKGMESFLSEATYLGQ